MIRIGLVLLTVFLALAVPAQQRIDEHWYQGTADSIYQNFYSIDIENPDQILILADRKSVV